MGVSKENLRNFYSPSGMKCEWHICIVGRLPGHVGVSQQEDEPVRGSDAVQLGEQLHFEPTRGLVLARRCTVRRQRLHLIHEHD
jgi:hypothetical protein